MARQTPGNYVPLDVNYARDIAVRKAGSNAELLFIRSLAYAKGARTSGFVSDFDLEVVAVGMRAVKAAAEKLVDVGLWVRVEEGWEIRSWERWNAGDRVVSAGGKLGNHKRWHAERGVVDPDCDLCAVPDSIAPRSHPDSPPISPPESQGKGREGKGTTAPNGAEARKRARRIPDDFTPTDSNRAWAVERGFSDGQIGEITGNFVRYWQAESGAKASKLDWHKTWQNWVAKEDPRKVRVATTAAATIYDTSKLPGRGEGWTPAQLDMVLGPDTWTIPEPPDDAPWNWEDEQKRRHFAERVQAALIATGRKTA